MFAKATALFNVTIKTVGGARRGCSVQYCYGYKEKARGLKRIRSEQQTNYAKTDCEVNTSILIDSRGRNKTVIYVMVILQRETMRIIISIAIDQTITEEDTYMNMNQE